MTLIMMHVRPAPENVFVPGFFISLVYFTSASPMCPVLT